MQLLRRHRLLSSILLIVTLLVTGASYFILPSTYQATSQVVFIPSKASAVKFGGNPYLAFSGSVTDAGDVIRYEVTSKSQVDALKAKGYTSSYTVTNVVGTNAPLLLVTVTGSTAANVEQTLKAVTDAINTSLDVQQSEFPKSAKITDGVVTFDSKASKLSSKKTRPVLMVLMSVLLPSIAILVIVDSVQANRKKKQRGRNALATEEPARAGGPVQHGMGQPNPEFNQMAAGRDSRGYTDNRGYADRGHR